MQERNEKGQFIKGSTPWIKGKTHSGYTRKIISSKLKGKMSGENNPFYGRTHSEETKQYWSNIRKGRARSPESIEGTASKLRGRKRNITWMDKMQAARRLVDQHGENGPNWKGGVTPNSKMERIKFRTTLQKKVFERDNYTCQLCGETGGYLQVDHIQSWADHVDKRFDISNCRTLCMSCHYFITYGRPMPAYVGTWGHGMLERGIEQ